MGILSLTAGVEALLHAPVHILTKSTLSDSYGGNILFPVKAAYHTGYICVVESHAFN